MLITKFNAKRTYEEKIAEKVNELKLLCNEEKIPMFFACAASSTEKRTEYVYEYIGTVPNEINLKNDKIADFVNVVNGFETVPPREIVEINFE